MFPEYASFKKHPWNKAALTPRQHFIAHLLLWKAFPLSWGQHTAAWQMSNRNGVKINSKLFESLRIQQSKFHKNKVTVRDSDGNTMKVSSNDPRYLSGELVVVTTGMRWKVRNTENFGHAKGKTYEELCGTDKAKQLKEKRSQSRKEWIKDNPEKLKTMHENFTKNFTPEELKTRNSNAQKKWRKENPDKAKAQYERTLNARKICEHCGKEMNIGNYNRWHGDNCKLLRSK